MPGKTKPRKRSTAKRQAKPKTPKEEAAEQPFNGILVHVLPTEDGGLNVVPQAAGEVRVTEVPTLLKKAAQAAEVNLGIG